MNHILLIDGNNIGYRSMCQPEWMMLHHRDRPIGGIVGMIHTLLKFSRIYPRALPMVLWDGHPQWRYELWPAYKACRTTDNRKQTLTEQWQQQSRLVQALLLYMGAPQLRADNVEAQDLAYYFCQSVEDSARAPAGINAAGTDDDANVHRITLVSHDKHWMHALSSVVDVHVPTQHVAVNLQRFLSGYAPRLLGVRFSKMETFVLAHAIAGDASKHIPGVPGVGFASAAQRLQRYGSLKGILNAAITGVAKDWKSQQIRENMAMVCRNYALMDASQSPYPHPVRVIWESFDADACADVCRDCGVDALLPQFAEYQWADRAKGWPKAAGKRLLASIEGHSHTQ